VRVGDELAVLPAGHHILVLMHICIDPAITWNIIHSMGDELLLGARWAIVV